MARNNLVFEYNETSDKKTERLSVRVDEATKLVLEYAASLEGITTSAFVIAEARRTAYEVIRKNEQIQLSNSDRDIFLSLLDNPTKPVEALTRAAARHKQFIENA